MVRISTNQCLLSVAMATYNGAKYLSEQLDSILAQTLAPDEIVIVDDCSTDDTWDLLSAYAQRYTQIKLCRNEINLGVIKTFEYALTLCTGEFIALADQDDYWLPNKLEILLNNIGRNWLIHSDAYIVDEQLNIIDESYSQVKPRHDNSLAMYLMRNDVTGCTVLLRRDLLKVALPFPVNVVMHDHYLALCAKFFDKLTYLNRPLIKYRQHSQNVVGSGNPQSYSAMINNYKKYILFLDSLQFSKIKFNPAQLNAAKSYFTAIVNASVPRFTTFKLTKQLFGMKNVVALFLYTIFGKRFAKFMFNRKKR